VEVTLELARREVGDLTRRPSGPVVAPRDIDAFFLDGEKVVWDWPDVSGRVIEELR
jgi:hypothetical protein